MFRFCLDFLAQWLDDKQRKPLIVRGARQVGKTWLVRHFAKSHNRQLIELNLEKQPQLAGLFVSNMPQQIITELGAALNLAINPSNSLLFLDEIQAAPELISRLRWFHENMPELPIIAAGSLLEFVLESYKLSMPVGRISYMHLEPLSFEEYLLATDKQLLYDYIKNYELNVKISAPIHEQLISLFKEYLIVGGMPAAVLGWIEEKSFIKVDQISHDLLATYRDDFAKYKGRLAVERLDEIIMAVPRLLGQKFGFSKINRSVSSDALKQALNLLNKARVCHRVTSCAANGVPLGAEVNEKFFKEIFLDVGLCSTSLGLLIHQIKSAEEISHINNGGLAEQVVGQLLRTIVPPYVEPELYYWHREKSGSSAEVDYVIQYGSQVIPIEVKAGSTGGLKSLHLFMGLKKLKLAIRINSDFASKVRVNVKDHEGQNVEYSLLSLPFYLIGQIHRLLEAEL